MKQSIDGIDISDNQQVEAILRLAAFYEGKVPSSTPPVTVRYNLAALKAAAMTIRDGKRNETP